MRSVSKAKERPWLEEPAMASETTPELEALVVGLFEVGAVKVRASLSLRACTCMRCEVQRGTERKEREKEKDKTGRQISHLIVLLARYSADCGDLCVCLFTRNRRQ